VQNDIRPWSDFNAALIFDPDSREDRSARPVGNDVGERIASCHTYLKVDHRYRKKQESRRTAPRIDSRRFFPVVSEKPLLLRFWA